MKKTINTSRENDSPRPRATDAGPEDKITLAERTYRLLKSEILLGRVEEGVFLDVESLLKRYGLGRTPFREACHRLHLERLVELVPRRGLIVREMSLREVRDLLEARKLIEPEVAALAAVRRSDQEVLRLEELGQRTVRAATSTELVRSNVLFHEAVAQTAKNSELMLLSKGVLDRMTRVAYLQTKNVTGDEVRELHEAIVNAVRESDPRAAREAALADILHGQGQVFPAAAPVA